MRFSVVLFLIGIALAGCAKEDAVSITPLKSVEKPDASLMQKAGEVADFPKQAGLGVCTLHYTNLRRDYMTLADRNAHLQRYVSSVVGAKQSKAPKKESGPSAPTS